MTETGEARDQDPWLHQEVVARRRPEDAREWIGFVLDRSAPDQPARYRVQPDRTALQIDVSVADMALYATRVRSRHLLVLWGDVELEIQGPYASEEERVAAASEIRADSDDDGVHWLDLVELDGVIMPHGGDWSGGAFAGDEADNEADNEADDASDPPQSARQ
jgi:hypothetical protein